MKNGYHQSRKLVLAAVAVLSVSAIALALVSCDNGRDSDTSSETSAEVSAAESEGTVTVTAAGGVLYANVSFGAEASGAYVSLTVTDADGGTDYITQLTLDSAGNGSAALVTSGDGAYTVKAVSAACKAEAGFTWEGGALK